MTKKVKRRYMTSSALAERWGVDRSTIHRWWKAGLISGMKPNGGTVLHPIADIERFERRHLPQPVSEIDPFVLEEYPELVKQWEAQQAALIADHD